MFLFFFFFLPGIQTVFHQHCNLKKNVIFFEIPFTFFFLLIVLLNVFAILYSVTFLLSSSLKKILYLATYVKNSDHRSILIDQLSTVSFIVSLLKIVAWRNTNMKAILLYF